MENIIKKAIEGGYKKSRLKDVSDFPITVSKLVTLDPLFWQALGKTEHWDSGFSLEEYPWKIYALKFHKINLTQGFDKAVEYLSELIKK